MPDTRILYIEDDKTQRLELAAILRKRGFSVTVASSGNVGLKYFKSRKFDAILCDLNMPGMDGIEVLDKVRPTDRMIPFVILTAHATVPLAVKAIRKGASHFIPKPAVPDEIIITLRHSIEHARLESRLEYSESTLKMVLENVPDVIYSLNNKGEFSSISKAVEQSLGYKPVELLGTSVFDIIYPDDKKRVIDGYRKSVKSRDRQVRNLRFRMISKAGDIRDCEISQKLIFDKDKFIRSDGIARDITERTNLEKQLKEYSLQLEAKVEERTQKLTRANRQLAELNKVSNQLSKLFDETKLFDKAPKLLAQVLDFDRTYLIIKANGKLNLVSSCCRNKMTAGLKKYIEEFKAGLVKPPPHFKRCLRYKKTIHVPELSKDKSWPKKPSYMAKAKSMVIAPLIFEGEVIGVIAGFRDEKGRLIDKQDVQRFEMFANIVSLSLNNIRAYQTLEQKVEERTKSLKHANEDLQKKTKQIDASRMELAQANVDLLSVQEQLEMKNNEMVNLLDELSRKHMELQIVVDSAPEVILLVDNDDNVQLINRAVTEFLGVNQAEIIGQKFSVFIDKVAPGFKDQNSFRKLIKQLEKKADDLESFEYTGFYKRGLRLAGDKSVILAPTSIKIIDESGREAGRLWDFANITKMVEADQQLHAIVNASPIPTIISRIDDGRVLYANEQLANLVGLSKDDVLGRYTTEFYFDAEDRHKIIERLKQDGFVRDIEVRLKKPDSSPIWTVFSLVITEIGGEHVVLGGIYDISHQKKVEQELISERNFVSAVLDTTSSLVVVLNVKGEVVRFNRACEQITGYNAREIIGTPLWQHLLIPDEIDFVKNIFNKLIAGDYPNQAENYWKTKAGRSRLISWSNTALLGSRGEIEYIVATGIDITEQRKAQEELKQAHDKLEQRVAERTAELAELNKVLEENHRRLKKQNKALADLSKSDFPIKGDLEYAMREITEKAADALDLARCGIWRYNKDKNRIHCIDLYDYATGAHTRGDIFNLIEYPVYSDQLKSKRLIAIDDISQDELAKELTGSGYFTSKNIQAIMDAPVWAGGEIIGIIRYEHAATPRKWMLQDEQFAASLADFVTLAIEARNRRQIQSALQESEAQNRALLNTIPDLMFRLDKDGKYLAYMAPKDSELMLPPENVIGKNIREMMPEGLAERTLRCINKALETNELQIIEYEMPHGDLIHAFEARLVVSGKDEVLAIVRDITLRKEAEQALKRSKEELEMMVAERTAELAKVNENLVLYKEIFMNTTDGIMILDKDAKILERNPAQTMHTGFTDTMLMGNDPSVLIGSEKFDKIFRDIRQQDGYRGELTFTRHDGVNKSVDLSIFALKDKNGDVIYYVSMGRDITERKAAEKALADRLRYEEGLANCSQALLTGTDYDNAINDALGYLLKATDTSRVHIFENFEDEDKGLCSRITHEACSPGVKTIINMPLMQRLPYHDELGSWWEFLEAGRPAHILVANMPPKTRELLESLGILSVAVIPIKVDGKWYGFLGFDDMVLKRIWSDEDIRTLQTAGEMLGIFIERRKFEEALRVSEDRFRNLVENANDIIYSTDADNILTYVSPTVFDILGFEPSELIGNNANALMHPEDKKESELFYKTGGFQERERWSAYRFRMRHKDGSYKWFVSNASVLFNEDGSAREIIGVAHDITEIQNLLEQLEKTNTELTATQSQLIQSEKMASLGMLVAGIAHEINTPIGAVASMHDTSVRAQNKLKQHMMEKYQAVDIKDDEDFQKAIKIIDDANRVIETGASRVTNIVRRLRSFARLDEAELQTTNIHEGLEDTLTLIHHEIKHDITVIREYGDIPEIACYPGQLNQVFLNLLVNASHAIEGKGTITLKTYPKDDGIAIEVTDTGSGIKPENLSKIFDPGFTTKGVGVGTGLGLAICYQIIQNHHGQIKAKSKVDEGTTFTIELPGNLEKLLSSEANKS